MSGIGFGGTPGCFTPLIETGFSEMETGAAAGVQADARLQAKAMKTIQTFLIANVILHEFEFPFIHAIRLVYVACISRQGQRKMQVTQVY